MELAFFYFFASLEFTDLPNLVLKKLSTPPALTTIRINLRKISLDDALKDITTLLQTHQSKLKGYLSEFTISYKLPEFRVWSNAFYFPEVIFISTLHGNYSHNKSLPSIIVDTKTGQSLLRGAHVYPPGLITAVNFGQPYDGPKLVNVFADISNKILFGQKTIVDDALYFLGVGIPLFSTREELLFMAKNSPGHKNQPLIQMLSSLPPITESSSLYSYQNLPSILVSKILHNLVENKNGRILDACSGYGGKTGHLAELFPFAEIIAVERSRPKTIFCAKLLSLSGHRNFHILCSDITKASFESFSFDGILLDPPCSGLGQRPVLGCTFSPSPSLTSFSSYQKHLLATISPWIKVGAPILYSTCSLSVEENENVVFWALDNLPLKLIDPQISFPCRRGISSPHSLLSEDNASRCIRFIPELSCSDDNVDLMRDTIAFFICSFIRIEGP